MSHEAKYVPPKRYPFTEDKIFGWVMENQEFCLYLLQIILPDLNIQKIVEFHKQDAMGNDDREAKDIRLDIKVVDDQGRIFDIEMQTTPSAYLGRRMRYYQSIIDGDGILKVGKDYSQLPDTYIIFLCSEDPSDAFSKKDDRAVHFFKTIDTKDGDLKLNDGATKVIINSKGDFASESAELKELANLMNDKEVSLNDQFIWAQNRVNELNKDRRSDIVSYEAKLMDRELYGRQEGIKKGREEGRQEGIKKGREEGRQEGQNEERLVGVKKSIDIALSFTQDDDAILNKVKSQYGDHFTDDDLKELIAKAKGKLLQEA
ncbi:hypothetical protein FC52_GL000701 [Lactobacillus pasteurii DSM 23907 = CRBIP 24.76]|uniref:Rpn family recombination-promoting nuclease/putative transposase n=3 Tax=Lactobacillus pasteurii TaxID=872327 RepID=I7LD43_9LACO|nr:Rpn family recombination-promoting nuclease/putative transposase [Lactobacillus pasteurii]KRK07377.1 hypothetical protein FC52_GL000701 [Lactobacillus pasteurii DSM 23907 = CRBIP 24.76]TDG77795.1 hypothetical protein C5L33_000019 [Lactobacillus pasteurii]CCI84563.1 Putative uncharacterized protein [Lactobacillus pasteurii DSM 23907 = CRBIP 24.76]